MSTPTSQLVGRRSGPWPGAATGTPAPRDPAIGGEPLPEAVGRYQVLARLGGGAMGVVYKCRQPGLDRPVAVKVMVAGRHATADQIQRFQREVWAAAQLSHPHVVQIYDVGTEGELHYFVMEYVDGWPLDKLIGGPTLTLERTLRLVAQVARALEAAHAQGIIHRDIKPSNIIVHRSGQPKLSDFGLAKPLGGAQDLSGSGDLIGTPRYMSPEQALAAPQDVDARTDVYSLGAVLYEMLTGRPPVDGPNVLTILRRLSDEDPAPVRALRPDLPEEVEAICRAAMAREREARFPSAAAFAEAVEGYLLQALRVDPALAPPFPDPSATVITGRPKPSRRPIPFAGRLLALLGVVAALTAGGYWVLRDPGRPSAAVVGGEDDGEAAEAGAVNYQPAPPAPRAAAPGAAKAGRGAPAPRPEPPAAVIVAEARDTTAAPRDRWKGLLDRLGAVLVLDPANREARFQRARAHRQVGQYLAALDDLNTLLAKEPKNLTAVTERLLADDQLYVLYLGNLNEPLLRPVRLTRLRDDARLLQKQGNEFQRHVAAIVLALADQDVAKAGQLVEKRLSGTVRREDVPDLAMVEADALLRAADAVFEDESAAPDGADKVKKRGRREQLVELARAAIRGGLEANPYHVGLLFLKANSFERAATWGKVEDEDAPFTNRQKRLLFEDALAKLRAATSVADSETAAALVVLLGNFGGREPQVLERINDALKVRPLHTVRAWYRLFAPQDGPLTVADVEGILHDLQQSIEAEPDDYNAYFVQALLQAAAGRPEEARPSLKRCQAMLGQRPLPTRDGNFAQWLSRANGPAKVATPFLDTTLDILWYMAMAEDVRLRVGQDVLTRLQARADVAKEGLKPEEVTSRTAWTHVRLAKSYVQKGDKMHALEHVRAALELKQPDLDPKALKEDAVLQGMNSDPDFAALYNEFQKKDAKKPG